MVVAGWVNNLSFSLASSIDSLRISIPVHKSVTVAAADIDFLADSNYQFPATGTLSSDKITTVSTFENISLYWKPFDGASTREALVRYRIKGTVKWAQAQSLWFDDRTADSIDHAREGRRSRPAS